LRDGKTIQLPLELKTKGSYTDRIGLVVSNALIGQKFSSSLSGIAEQVINADNHLVVQSVEAGLASGIVEEQDIILKVDGRTIKTVQELKKYLEGKKQVELILRSLKNFGDKVVFFDRYESLEIKEVEYLRFK
jgi:C-terminal processing protease CtpA/Prc